MKKKQVTKGMRFGDLVITDKEGLENVLHKALSSDPDQYKTECQLTVYNEQTKTTKTYDVFRDRTKHAYINVWFEDRGIVSVLLTDFQ